MSQKTDWGRGKLSRRDFLKFISASAMGTLLTSHLAGTSKGPKEALAAPPDPLVIRAFHPNATRWDFQTGYYWDFVNQSAVDAMVDRGIRELTRRSTIVEAWRLIMASYQTGQRIAIKVNCNGNLSHTVADPVIDVTVEPILAILRGLTSIGIQQTCIDVYDASRFIHTRYIDRIRAVYPDVRMVSNDNVLFGQTGDPDEWVRFSRAEVNPNCGEYPYAQVYIADVLIRAQHLINLCILKAHGTGVTGAFKNHFGTISSPGCMHSHCSYDSNNPIVDIYMNRHILDKTRLIISDGLFGSWSHLIYDGGLVHPWNTFGNGAPNSMFFSLDPVALDSIMYDYIYSETNTRGIYLEDAHFLHDAAARNLGTHEHRPYSRIQYKEVDASIEPPPSPPDSLPPLPPRGLRFMR